MNNATDIGRFSLASAPVELRRSETRSAFIAVFRGAGLAQLVAVAIVVLHLVVAIGAPVVAPASPTAMSRQAILAVPSSEHPMGTDKFGRDILSRVVWGGRTAMFVAIAATVLSLTIAGGLALLAGYVQGWTDLAVSRFMELLLTIPSLLFALVLVALFGPNLLTLIGAIGVVYVPRLYRPIRVRAMEISSREFVAAARARGEGLPWILFREILPNTSGLVIVEFAIHFSGAILLVASLGFLGLGVQPPTPDWGMMVNENRGVLANAPWTVLFPAAAITSLFLAANIASDLLQSRFDRPVARQRQ